MFHILWLLKSTADRQLFFHPHFADRFAEIVIDDLFLGLGGALAASFGFLLSAGVQCGHDFGDGGALGFGLVKKDGGQAFHGIVATADSAGNLVNFTTFFQELLHLLLQLAADLMFGGRFVHKSWSAIGELSILPVIPDRLAAIGQRREMTEFCPGLTRLVKIGAAGGQQALLLADVGQITGQLR